MPNVVDSFGQKTPSTPPVLALCAASRFSLVANALSVVAPPYWLSLTILMPGFFLMASRKPFSRLVVLADPSW